MKPFFKIKSTRERVNVMMFIAATILILVIPSSLWSQSDTSHISLTDSSAVSNSKTKGAPETISPSLQFSAVQKSDNSIDLKASLKTKLKGQSYNLYLLKVVFYNIADQQEIELGHAITDGSGKAVFNVKADSLKTDAEGKLQFKAVFAGNNAIEAAEEVFSFKRAKLEITPIKEDSLLSVQVKLVDLGTGKVIPVKDATIGIFVKRSFLPLKVGEGTTDENGEATVEFPKNLPGDAKGNLTIIGRMDENEIYGNLESSAVQPWGVPVSDLSKELPRALWSSHPPMWMIITFGILMVVVWGHYIIIVYDLFRLRKEQPHFPTDATNT